MMDQDPYMGDYESQTESRYSLADFYAGQIQEIWQMDFFEDI